MVDIITKRGISQRTVLLCFTIQVPSSLIAAAISFSFFFIRVVIRVRIRHRSEKSFIVRNPFLLLTIQELFVDSNLRHFY